MRRAVLPRFAWAALCVFAVVDRAAAASARCCRLGRMATMELPYSCHIVVPPVRIAGCGERGMLMNREGARGVVWAAIAGGGGGRRHDRAWAMKFP